MTTPVKMGQRAVLRTFTPEDCTKHLEKTDDARFQRPLSQVRVNTIAEDLRNGRWQVNGETIVLAKDGSVLDGQHRMWAAIEAGADLATWVIEGVDTEAFQTIDTGAQRTGSDMVAIVAKTMDSDALSGSARSAVARAARMLLRTDAQGRFTVDNRKRPTNIDVAGFVRDNPDILDCSRELASMGGWPVPLGLVLVVRYFTQKSFPSAMDEFFRPLQSGLGLVAGDHPVTILRNKAIRHPRPGDFRAERDIFAQLIKAWNAWACGEQISALRYAAGIEAFPSICRTPGVKPKNVKYPQRRKLVKA